MKNYLLVLLTFSLIPLEMVAQSAGPKEATSYTRKANSNILSILDFSDSTDYVNARRGFIATYPEDHIGKAYDLSQFNFIKGQAPAEVNPSLWRQSELNAIAGLFKVTDNVYQIRGFDLANMTLIKGKSGWIVIDPLTVEETAKAGMQLVKQHLGDFPVTAIIITHSHIDHFGGMRAVLDEKAIAEGKQKIYAPDGFVEHAVSENVLAGNTMGRRAGYMYGNLLPKSTTGSVGSGLGTTTATGTSAIAKPTDIISSEDGQQKVIDGLKVDFIYTPDSEAPAEMMFYFPELRMLVQAENVNHTLHNLYTLRGAQVRNGQKWSIYIDRILARWGDDVAISIGMHHWPTWGNTEVRNLLESQRDLYRFIHDQTLRLANTGLTPLEIADSLALPEDIDRQFSSRGYYGSLHHNIRAQYQLYFGFFDGNPANLHPLPPAQVGKKYIELAGGSARILEQARKSFDLGEYRWVAELVNHVVFAEPNNKPARELLADTYEQMGYQAESAPWRNFYLSGAQELRSGVSKPKETISANKNIVADMSSDLFFNYLAMRYNGLQEHRLKHTFNFNLTDTDEKVSLILSNGTLHPRVGSHAPKNVSATITLPRSVLMALASDPKNADLAGLEKKGTVKIEGDREAFTALLNNIVNFDKMFNIIEP
ncbi:alkyl sulfatase dimerization domain-containing protein [Sphingobacterium oryzagri]|uniref:Alkyl sulfatase dimerization domain-containing protein n=1 Tax=Sphingobacterium oryzagri TaxID=3025669 RepID=A0ABY7WE01_9SPHI|nr:alkyl sulfatase dimerization domain-containing protein [Sphingobacterium sp. KACC 22765]WDF66834.1 alkyl sulfatase dimerization domain-containing protein [Sphingobacterium sp. KACC 22765]